MTIAPAFAHFPAIMPAFFRGPTVHIGFHEFVLTDPIALNPFIAIKPSGHPYVPFLVINWQPIAGMENTILIRTTIAT